MDRLQAVKSGQCLAFHKMEPPLKAYAKVKEDTLRLLQAEDRQKKDQGQG
jgi:hypothetical protein